MITMRGAQEMNRGLSILLALTVLSAPGYTQSTELVKQNLQAQLGVFQKAVKAADYAKAATFLHKDFKFTTMEGRVMNKAQYVSAVKETMSTVSNVKLSYNLTDVDVKNSVAVGNVNSVTSGAVFFEKAKHGLRMEEKNDFIWHKVQNKWQMMAITQTAYCFVMDRKPVSVTGMATSGVGVRPIVSALTCSGKSGSSAKSKRVSSLNLLLKEDGKFRISLSGPNYTAKNAYTGTWTELNETEAILVSEPSASSGTTAGKGIVVFASDGLPHSITLDSTLAKTGEKTKLEVIVDGH